MWLARGGGTGRTPGAGKHRAQAGRKAAAGFPTPGLWVRGTMGPDAWVEVLNGSSVRGGEERTHWHLQSRPGCRGPCQGDSGSSLRAAGLGLLGSLGLDAW